MFFITAEMDIDTVSLAPSEEALWSLSKDGLHEKMKEIQIQAYL